MPKKRCPIVAEHFGKKLTEIMDATQMSARGLAKQMGCTAMAVGHWKHGRSLPCSMSLFELCKHFNTSPNEMLGWGEYAEVISK